MRPRMKPRLADRRAATNPQEAAAAGSGLRRALGLRDLIVYGLIVIQPTAPMPVFGIVSERARGHVVTAVLLAMVAMLFTAISYGRMARAHPSAGSAFVYVGRELHPLLGYVTGWAMALDYLLNPLISIILCAQLSAHVIPQVPYAVCAVFFASLFTALNLVDIRTSARINAALAAGMCLVIAVFFAAVGHALFGHVPLTPAFLTRPFFDPATFAPGAVLGGASLAVLTYIGFDGISTLAEEARNPHRDILRATVLVCLLTGLLAGAQVYAAQLIWPASRPFPDVVTAFVHVAGAAGGTWLLQLVNATLLVATIGSGTASQLGAARLLYGMGRADALPKVFFGKTERKRQIPRNNVLLCGGIALIGALLMSFDSGVNLLNFGALIAFMGVNVACLTRYFVRAPRRRALDLLLPASGFAICLMLWWNLSSAARLAGSAWLVFGLCIGLSRGWRFTSPHP